MWFKSSFLALALVLANIHAVLAIEPDYRLNPGDVLQVTVWKEDNLDREAIVLPDGNINFPLAGTIRAGGLTVTELHDQLVTKLSKDIPGVSLIVMVKQALGNAVQVIGQVSKPGEIAIGHRMTVMQALSLAGGLTPFASESQIRVLHRDPDGTQVATVFPYNSVIRGEDLEKNIELSPGDLVMVPAKSLF